MFDHLRSGSAGDVHPHSKAGEWTIDLLLLNEPARVKFRKAMIHAVSLALETERRLRETIEVLEERVKVATGATQAELFSEKKKHERRLEDVVATRRTLTGP
jgi:hypothetical protein